MPKKASLQVFDPRITDYTIGRDGEPNWGNRSVYIGDCLDVMRQMNSGSVDLIYLDPPFNKKKQFQAPIGTAAEGSGFKDFWTWDDIKNYEADELKKQRPEIVEFIKVVKSFRGESEGAYLLMMATRLLECYRLLKSTGSLYLHCDHSMNGYLRIVLDIIFEASNLRNEIAWCYKSGGASPSKKFSSKHDTIFWFTKTENYNFNPQKEKSYNRQLKPYRFKGIKEYKDDVGWHTLVGMKDYWYIDMVGRTSSERVGYPTQKPLALLERIIQASSNPGDMVLDPFCGCATTLIASEKLNRQYTGIDIGSNATGLLAKRLDDETRLGNIIVGKLVKPIIHNKPPIRTDLGGELKSPKKKTEYKKILYGQQDGNCAGCGEHFPARQFALDRIVPGASGGTYHPGNVQLLCPPCNSMKGARSNEYLFRQLDRHGFRNYPKK